MMDGPKRSKSGWPPGHQFGTYTVVDRIGEGAMGVVYLAEDPANDRKVAVKVLHSDVASNPTKRKRFVREGRFLNALTHPCICSVYEVGEQDDRVFIAMEYLDGDTLTRTIKTRGRIGVDVALAMGKDVAAALGEAHELGIIHRDLKPDNIMVLEGDRAKILDFGIAKSNDPQPAVVEDTSSDLTTRGQVLGTPAYMSPEQAKGLPVDQRSDVFSMGIVLYEMVTGRRPFEGETWQELIIAVNRDVPKPLKHHNGEAPDELQTIVDRCLEKKPEDRYKNCVAVADALSRLIVKRAQPAAPAPSPASAAPSAAGEPRPPAAKPTPMVFKVREKEGLLVRYPWLLTALVLVGLVVLTVVGMAIVARAG